MCEWENVPLILCHIDVVKIIGQRKFAFVNINFVKIQ